MKHLFIYLFIYLSFGCSNKENKKIRVLESKEVTSKTAGILDSLRKNQPPRIDTLSISQVLFNKQGFNISYEKLKNKEKDSIVFSEWVCGSPFEWASDSLDDYEYYNYYSYYTKNRLEYITNKYDAILFSGNFEGNVFEVKNTNITLNEKTTLNDFRIFFPNSYEHYIKTKNEFPQDYKGNDHLYVGFEEEHPYDHWIFYFDKKTGYLISFELYWWLC